MEQSQKMGFIISHSGFYVFIMIIGVPSKVRRRTEYNRTYRNRTQFIYIPSNKMYITWYSALVYK
jgi:hypothetical protein